MNNEKSCCDKALRLITWFGIAWLIFCTVTVIIVSILLVQLNKHLDSAIKDALSLIEPKATSVPLDSLHDYQTLPYGPQDFIMFNATE